MTDYGTAYKQGVIAFAVISFLLRVSRWCQVSVVQKGLQEECVVGLGIETSIFTPTRSSLVAPIAFKSLCHSHCKNELS